MKRTFFIAALATVLFVSCNNSIDDAQISKDVHRLVAKTEQCYANVHNDLIDSLDVEYFNKCNDELIELMDEMEKKYSDEKKQRKFDSIFFEEIRRSDLDNDIISMMEEIYEMNYEE